MYTPSALKIFYQDRLWHSLLTAIHSFMSSPSGIWTASFKLPLPRVRAACCGIGGRRWDGSRKRRGEWVGSSTILLNPADSRLGGPYTGPVRGLWGPRANRKSGAHNKHCVRGGLGARPWKFWDFTCSEVCSGGFLRLLFKHAYSTYIPASCRFRLAVSDRKVQRMGPKSAAALKSRKIKCVFWSLRQQRKREAKKQA